MESPFFQHRTTGYKPLLAWFCLFALLWTIFLLFAGGFTTSIQAGMAFLDWPLSNGSINPDGWLTDRDMRAEHSHRILGTKVGILTAALFLWFFIREERKPVRRLAGIALGMVIVQGLLGGARVRFDQLNLLTEGNALAQGFAIAHACLAQIFLCVLVTLAICASRMWIEQNGRLRGAVDKKTRMLGIATCTALFFQLLIGAIVRHNHAGLAIPYFPKSNPDCGWLPMIWTFPISIHFAHRIGALVVTAVLLAFVWRILRSDKSGKIAQAGGLAIVALLAIQIFLGALTVLTLKNEYAATLHMLFGAFLLGTTWFVTFLCFRLPLPSAEVPEPQTDQPETGDATDPVHV